MYIEHPGRLEPGFRTLHCSSGEVHRKKSGEEHQFGREPNYGADCNQIGPISFYGYLDCAHVADYSRFLQIFLILDPFEGSNAG